MSNTRFLAQDFSATYFERTPYCDVEVVYSALSVSPLASTANFSSSMQYIVTPTPGLATPRNRSHRKACRWPSVDTGELKFRAKFTVINTWKLLQVSSMY